jgi:hypothetical protein
MTENLCTYFESIENKSEIEYLNKYFSAIIENTLKNLELLNSSILTNEDRDKLIVSKIVVMAMLCLYNHRHQYKIIEEKTKGSSPRKFKPLRNRFNLCCETIQNLCQRESDLF